MYHSNKTRKRYREQYVDKDAGCPFCPPLVHERLITEHEHFVIIENGIKYDQWEGHEVTEHLLLIPRVHIDKIGELSMHASAEMVKIISDYEAEGYNIYARGFKSQRRSVAHQHTHLIKISGKRARIMLFIEKPYLLFRV